MQDLDDLYTGANVPGCPQCGLKLENRAHPLLKAVIAQSGKAPDYISHELFEKIICNRIWATERRRRCHRQPARPAPWLKGNPVYHIAHICDMGAPYENHYRAAR